MEQPKVPSPDLRIKFELCFRRNRRPLLPWFVISIALLGLIERVLRMWIET